jgi:hypothetical protein
MNWLPIYISAIGWKSVSGYITIGYEVAAILGSFAIGLLHQQNSSQSGTFFRLKYILYINSGFICTIATIATMILWLSIG